MNPNPHTAVCLHKRTLVATCPPHDESRRSFFALKSVPQAFVTPASFLVAVVMWLTVIARADLPGATLTRLHSFGDLLNSAVGPMGVIEGSDGALYGTSQQGGTYGHGSVFKVNKDGSGFALLKSFNSSTDGELLTGGVIEGSDGALYGTAQRGGTYGDGTVFRLSKDGSGFAMLRSFNNSSDGRNPTGLIEGTDGALYGTTYQGGAYGVGMIFRLNKNGSGFAVLKSINASTEGAWLNSGVIEASDSALYGTAFGGGASGSGTVFRLNKDGSGFAVLKNLNYWIDGAILTKGVIEGSDGVLYGAARDGGAFNGGTVFRLNKDGSGFTVLQSFNYSSDGGNPTEVIEASDGVLYGTAGAGGASSGGTAFRLTKDGSDFTVLKSFNYFPDGTSLEDGVIEGSDGTLYGTARGGGASGSGTVFRLNKDGSDFAVLKSLNISMGGAFPDDTLIEGSDGALYGTSISGGTFGYGTVFRLNKNGSGFAVLKSFNYGTDGAFPYSGVTEGSDGALYGTAAEGGTFGSGTVFRLNKNGNGFAVLKSFNYSTEGVGYHSSVTECSDGALYGTAQGGYGTVFRLNKDGSNFAVLKSFDYWEAVGPFSVKEGRDGALYGTSIYGGAFGYGTVFRLNKDGSGFAVLKSFNYSTDGGYLDSGVSEASDGVLYGAASLGGTYGYGTAFRLNKDGSGFVMLKSFNYSTDGGHPYGGVTEASDGLLYGAAYDGGASSGGTVFRLAKDGSDFEVVYALGSAVGEPRFPYAIPLLASDGRLYAVSEGGGDLNFGTVFALEIITQHQEPSLTSMIPTSAVAGGLAFTLTANGSNFKPGAIIYWNGSPRQTTYISPDQITAAIPANDLISTADIATAAVTVKNGNSAASNPLAFSIVAESVGNVVAAFVPAGGTASASTAPATSGEAGVTLSISNTGGDPITATAATYDAKPVGETAFRVDNGAFVDVQIIGADSSDSATVYFYYPSTVTGGQENSVKLRYYDGANWITVLSSGGTAPVKSTTDNLDSTVSGGRFTVTLDGTSTPKITELSGTVFGMFDTTPQVGTLSGPAAPLALGTSATISVPFAVLGDWTAARVTFIWDDGSETTIAPSSLSSALATKTYSAPGVYTVTVRLTDQEGSSAEKRFEYIVVYDPNGGFVTGGGWINSPAGAYVTEPALIGKASFGFTSQYKKGANVPTGQTEFQLHFATFNFKSTSYQWLVVSGAKAQYKGSGIINGAGDYGFLLTATDGQVNGGGGVDRFRIKILNKTTGAAVYDNVAGASDDLDAANPQGIGGGSIVIHKAK